MKTFLFPLTLLLSACSGMAPGIIPPAGTAALNAQASAKRLQIRVFRSYGNEGTVHVRARVMKPENQRPESPSDSSLLNFWRNLTALSVKEVAGVAVELTLNGKSQRFVSDKEGMIQAPVQGFGPLAPGIHTLQASLSPGQAYTAPVVTEKMVIQASQAPSLGIVSDIDDTIKISNVTNKLKSLRRLLFSNSFTVGPVPGTSVLYQRLDQRLDGQINNGDVHYLSGSPINLSDTIYNFMDFRNYPKGSVDLKKWGFGPGDDNPIHQENYKQEKLRQLFQTYPQRSFLLFGDSGEKDPEIYRAIATEFPGRVKGIFINNVSKSKPNEPRFQGVHLTANATEQAQILLQSGLLSAEDVEAVGKATTAYTAFAQANNLY
jgi:phosphatidate phosphatase APP1